MKDHLETSIFGEHEEHLDRPDGEHFDEPHTASAPLSRRELRQAQEAARRGGRRRRGASTGSDGAGRGGGRGKPSVFRRLVVIVLALAVIGGGVAVAYKALRPVVEGFLESNDYPGPGTGQVDVTIDEGAGGSAIAKTLAEQDVVKSAKAFIEAANDNPKSAGIQPGIYELRKQMKASDALAVLVDPKNRLITRVVVPEGLWTEEIYARLSKASGIPVAEY